MSNRSRYNDATVRIVGRKEPERLRTPAVTESMIRKYYRPEDHPYRIFERTILPLVRPGALVLDAGCGRHSDAGAMLKGSGARVVGLDLVDDGDQRIAFAKSNLENLPVRTGSMDLVISRSVMEHLQDPLTVWREARRVLKSDGAFVFLTPNFLDYVSLVAWLIPNRLHPAIVRFVEGREEEDVFPTAYRCNTPGAIRRLAQQSGFGDPSVQYLGQYPSSLCFSRIAFMLGVGYERLVGTQPLRFLRPWLIVVVKPRPNIAL
jgi:ubiquinone/menaquinone biosynthesis C-methylase UbiE